MLGLFGGCSHLKAPLKPSDLSCPTRAALVLVPHVLSVVPLRPPHRDFPVEDVFTLPVYFSSDWLNEFWDALDVDDYRFVYAGPAGSW